MMVKGENRFYRRLVKAKGLVCFEVSYKETDLQIAAVPLPSAPADLSAAAHRSIVKFRQQLEAYIKGHPEFARSLQPLTVKPAAPEIAQVMAREAEKVGVGPMAAVAGAMAEFVGRELLKFSPEIIVENGGDIFMCSTKPRVVSIYAGQSPLSLKLGIKIAESSQGLGVCTSSATVGPSLSLGRADAVVIVSPSAAFADAAATSVCNIIKSAEDLNTALDYLRPFPEISGAVIIINDHLAAYGQIELVNL